MNNDNAVTPAPKKGMVVSVLRDANGRDCTNGGITSRFTEFVLYGPGIPELSTATEKRPALRFDPRMGIAAGHSWACAYPEPTDGTENMIGGMMGGNFVYSCDSRFVALNLGNPIPVHDRFETPEHYRLASF